MIDYRDTFPQIISPVYVDVLGTADFVTPFLCTYIHAGIEIGVIENDCVCIKYSSNGRAASVAQDTAKHFPVPVKFLHTLL